MSKLADALAWVSAQRKQHIAESGSIERDGVQTCNVSMTVAKTMADVEGAGGVTVRTNIADFIITAADYKIGGLADEPRRGDIITYGGKQYRAVPIGGDEVWRYAENVNRTSVRVHTKEIGNA